MKRFLLFIWRWMPFWMQRLAAAVLYAHYQVAVGALIFDDRGRLLLCEHTYRRRHPWGLPGGDLKFGEDPQDGVRREVLEETGLTVGDARLLLAENSREIRLLTLTYLCTGVEGKFVPNEEVARIRYFDTGEIPDFFREQRATIEKCLAILDSEK